jgi:hypothetical protein
MMMYESLTQKHVLKLLRYDYFGKIHEVVDITAPFKLIAWLLADQVVLHVIFLK